MKTGLEHGLLGHCTELTASISRALRICNPRYPSNFGLEFVFRRAVSVSKRYEPPTARSLGRQVVELNHVSFRSWHYLLPIDNDST